MPRGQKSKKKKNSIEGEDHTYMKKKRGDFSVLVDENSDSESDSSTDEEAPCFGCKKTLEKTENGVCCNFCEHWYCLSCSKLKKAVYQALKASPDNLMWFCSHCLTAFPGVKKMMLKMGSLEDRVDKLETRVEQIEKAPQNPDKKVEHIVREEIREVQDIQSRKLNLVCFNLPESDQEMLEDRKMDDVRQLQNIIDDDMQLIDSEIRIKNPIRLGKKDDGQETQKRPLMFSVDAFEVKREILKGNAKLKQHQDEMKKKVFITPDLTKKQRDEAFKLREELRYRRNVLHEQNIKISNGRIVTIGDNDSHASSQTSGQSRHKDYGGHSNVNRSRTFTNSSTGSRIPTRKSGGSTPPRLFRN